MSFKQDMKHGLRSAAGGLSRSTPLALRSAPSVGIPERVALGASERLFLALHRFSATNVVRVMALAGNLTP